MSLTESLSLIKDDPQGAVLKLVDEIQDRIGNMSALMLITPPTLEDRAEYGKAGKNDNASKNKMLAFEKKLVQLLPIIWKGSEQSKTSLTEKYSARSETRSEFLSILMGNPVHSFVKTTLNRRAWATNHIYRINVNFEGYAYWNASVFYHVALKIAKMAEDDANLVLRTIAFNETISCRSMFAPKSKTLKGAGNHASQLSPERYRELLTTFCLELSNTIISHRQRTGRRYSGRRISENSDDEHTREIVKQIKHIYKKHRESAERIVLKQKKGV